MLTLRLGYRGAQAPCDVRPDLTTFAEIIGGRADVSAVFDCSEDKATFSYGGTFFANPVTMRAGLVSVACSTRTLLATSNAAESTSDVRAENC